MHPLPSPSLPHTIISKYSDTRKQYPGHARPYEQTVSNLGAVPDFFLFFISCALRSMSTNQSTGMLIKEKVKETLKKF